MRQAILHVAVVVRDYDEAIDYYCKKLHFTLVEDSYQPEQDKRWVIVSPPGSNGASLLLARASTPGQEAFIGNQTGGRVFLFLRTDDFWRDYHEMLSAGIHFVREPKHAAYGTVAVFEDLYGNLWDLIQPSGQASMTDMLVKLYDIRDDWSFLSDQAALGVTIRKPIGPEKHLVTDWVRENFGDTWASEADVALSNRPVTCFVALQSQTLIGFACYDATALGFFGPGGVAERYRGKGTGKALLLACLLDMKLKGYGYAIVGDVGPAGFYVKSVGAVEIPNSTPGVYKTMLRRGE